MVPPIPDTEIDRLVALRRYRILDTAPEEAFDDITKLASFICEAPIALMTLVDRERQWFKSKLGWGVQQIDRKYAFCSYTILQPNMLVVEDATKDERFLDNPLVTAEPHIRFYAGMPLITTEGHALGSLCVIDHQPRQISDQQKSILEALARMVVTCLELRRTSADLADAAANIKVLAALLPICSHCRRIRDDKGYWQQVEAYIQAHTDTQFSHGICPECAREYYPDIDWDKQQAVRTG